MNVTQLPTFLAAPFFFVACSNSTTSLLWLTVLLFPTAGSCRTFLDRGVFFSGFGPSLSGPALFCLPNFINPFFMTKSLFPPLLPPVWCFEDWAADFFSGCRLGLPGASRLVIPSLRGLAGRSFQGLCLCDSNAPFLGGRFPLLEGAFVNSLRVVLYWGLFFCFSRLHFFTPFSHLFGSTIFAFRRRCFFPLLPRSFNVIHGPSNTTFQTFCWWASFFAFSLLFPH